MSNMAAAQPDAGASATAAARGDANGAASLLAASMAMLQGRAVHEVSYFNEMSEVRRGVVGLPSGASWL